MSVINELEIDGSVHDVGAKAQNVTYGNGSVKDVLDNIGLGGGEPVPISDASSSISELKRVFIRGNYQDPEYDGWSTKMENFVAEHAIDVEFDHSIVLTLEVWNDMGISLGASAITQVWFFGKSYQSIVHQWNGKRDVYKFQAAYKGSTTQGVTTLYSSSSFAFRLPSSCVGHEIRVAAFIDYDKTTFRCKNCGFTTTNSSGTLNKMDFRNEWEDDATTIGKFHALATNHMIPMCSVGSEYDPFVERITTPRVLVTIVSDDGGAGDYKTLNPFLKGKAAEWNESHPNNDPVDIRWSCAVPSNYVRWDETHLGVNDAVGSCMTANMIRDLVANHGVSVLAHGYNHDYILKDNVYMTEAELDLVAYRAKMQLERQVGIPCIHYCLPGGKSASVNSGGYSSDKILSRYFLSAAHIQVKEAGTPLMNNVNTPDTDRFQIRRVSFDIGSNDLNAGDTQIAFIEAAQNYVTQNSKSAWVVFYTHAQEWKTGGVAHALTIPAVVDYCLENGIAMVNYSEAFAEMYPPIDRLKTLLGINS